MLTTKDLSDTNVPDTKDHSHKINELEQEKILLHGLMEWSGSKVNVLEQFKKNLEEKVNRLYGNLEKSEKQYRELYDGAPDLYRTIDIHGIILDCNRAYTNSLGYSKDEVIGSSIFDYVDDSDMSALNKLFTIWKKTGHIENREILMKRKDGSTFPALISASNLYDENRNLIGSNTVIKDITEISETRKKLEQSQMQIQRQLEELQRLDTKKSEFLTMITHELKTPLVPMKAYIDILISEVVGPLNSTQKERLRLVKSSSESLLRLIQDLLDAQKLELGKLSLDRKIHNISKIIRDTVTKFQPEAEEYKIQIMTNVKEGILCYCDKCRIEQVLINILSNSFDFCSRGKGLINVTLEPVEQDVKIIIKDNGAGMTHEELAKIFGKFYQVNTTTTREHGGTGLGLVICKGIVESHGGKIWIESEGKGKGIEVHILLPLTAE